MATLQSPATDELLTNIRNMLNQPDSTNSFWSDEELLVYINEGIRRYFSEVVHRLEGQFTTTVSLDIVSGTETVSLPSDCFEVKALYRKVSNGYEICEYDNNFTSSYVTTGTTGGSWYVPSYFFRGNNIVLRNVPNFSETGGLLLEYIQFPDTMITGGDTLTSQVSPVFKDLIEMYAVWKGKTKESLVNNVDTTKLAKENLNDLFTAFKEAVTNRSKYPQFVKPFNPEEY